MKWGLVIPWLVAFASCTRSNPYRGLRPGEICSDRQVCAQGSYALCQVGDSCRYLASDGSGFSCASCALCGGAQFAVAQWCIVGGTTGGGTSGGGTTGGGTTGGGTSGGGTSGGGTSGGGTSGGGTTGSLTCAQCADNAQAGVCATQANNCFNDFECSDLATCINACSSQSCQMGCFDMASATAQAEYNAAADCNCSVCASPCAAACNNRVRGGSTTGGTSGGTSGGGTSGGGTSGGGTSGGTSGGGTTGSLDCQNCAQSVSLGGACSTQAQACFPGTACGNYAQCLSGCSSDPCRQTCAQNAGPTAVNQYNAVNVCICDNCSVCNC